MEDEKPTAVVERLSGPGVRAHVRPVDPGLNGALSIVVPRGVVELGSRGAEPQEIGPLDAALPLEELGLAQRGRRSTQRRQVCDEVDQFRVGSAPVERPRVGRNGQGGNTIGVVVSAEAVSELVARAQHRGAGRQHHCGQ